MEAAKDQRNQEISQAEAISTSEKKVESCECCGQPLPTQKGRGRKRVFCDDKCKRMVSVLSWVEDLVADINFTPEQATKVRRQLWMTGNQVKTTGQKGVK